MLDPVHLHPMIVHFPIALIIVGLVSEVAGLVFRRSFFTDSAVYLVLLGTIGLVAAYITGNLAGGGVVEAGSLKAALEKHEDAALLTMILMIAFAAIRLLVHYKKWFKGWVRYGMAALFVVGVLAIARTGFYGGELVFKHAAGVQLDFGFGSNLDNDLANPSGDLADLAPVEPKNID